MTFGGPFLLAPLTTVLGIRPGMNVSIQAAPEGFFETLGPLPEGCALTDKSRLGIDLTVLFVRKQYDVVAKLAGLVQGMSVTGSIWVCFPTADAKPSTPSEDFVRLAALEHGLVDVKLLPLDPSWNGLKFQWKPRAPRLEKPQVTA